MSAILNNSIHLKFGQRGVAFLGPLCHLLAYIINCVHPPYPVLVISFILAGFGNGLLDAGWNAWLGAVANANEILGFLHAFYGLGATIAPLIATAMITKADLPWYYWYYCMVGFAGLEVILSTHAFWKETGAKRGGRFGYVLHPDSSQVMGGEVANNLPVGGWIVEFMIRKFQLAYWKICNNLLTCFSGVRHAANFASGMSATGFWLGMTVGRVVLGFVSYQMTSTPSLRYELTCPGHTKGRREACHHGQCYASTTAIPY
ncbi:hypothetical protein MRB53_041120 [Persea americana]|nr:hypothetical protein MRB53_041120 [Persea americana]